MCQPRRGSSFAGMGSHECCCGCGPSTRRFFSTKEEEECLQNYKDQLMKEIAGVEQRLTDLKGK